MTERRLTELRESHVWTEIRSDDPRSLAQVAEGASLVEEFTIKVRPADAPPGEMWERTYHVKMFSNNQGVVSDHVFGEMPRYHTLTPKEGDTRSGRDA